MGHYYSGRLIFNCWFCRNSPVCGVFRRCQRHQFAEDVRNISVIETNFRYDKNHNDRHSWKIKGLKYKLSLSFRYPFTPPPDAGDPWFPTLLIDRTASIFKCSVLPLPPPPPPPLYHWSSHFTSLSLSASPLSGGPGLRHR